MPGIREVLYGEDTLRLELLSTPVRGLGLRLAGTRLGRCVSQIRRELRREGFALRPTFYLSDEYGCVPFTAHIGLGFWDADERLRRLNQEYRNECWTWDEILRVLRHEVGHAFCYAYRIYRRPDFRRLFNVRGHFFNSYPQTRRFSPRPWSRDFVNPFGDHYAQRHPDEDFAETFSEWLTFRTWRRKYASRPGARRKLEYVDSVVSELKRRPPELADRELHVPADSIRMTVARFLRGSTRKYRRRAAGYVDRDLKSLFLARPNGVPTRTAAEFLADHRARLLPRVARAAQVEPRVVASLLDKLSRRADALDLRVRRRDERRALVDVTALVTSLATRYHELGRLR